MNRLEFFLGEACKILFPINEEVFHGNPESKIAICTLSSIELLKKISNSELMKEINIVGRLFSENVGIESLVNYSLSNKKLKFIILCGKEVWGHKTGHSLLSLQNNGIDNNGRIKNSISPDPFLKISEEKINQFRNKIKIIDMIDVTDYSKISQRVRTLSKIQ